MRSIDLCKQSWTVQAVGDVSMAPEAVRGREIPANVPGCVHTDLIRAGLLGDPRIGLNERDGQWVGMCDWVYRTRIIVDAELLKNEERIDLVCEGLDTIAELQVNGASVGTAANMFHPHRFDLRSAVRAGENELAITFRSPLKHIRAEEARLGTRPYNGDGIEGGWWVPFQFIRKAACNFGWDWGPRVATCGIWKPIKIEVWSGVRIAGVRPLVRREPSGEWRVQVETELEWSGGRRPIGNVCCCAEIPEDGDADAESACEITRIPLGTTKAVATLHIREPRLWWPRGHGDQSLYPLEITVTDNYESETDWNAEVLAETTVQIGFREVRLNTEPDQHGSKFQIEVNGKPIFCKGANWIPEGLFPDDRAPEVIRARLQQAAATNMNMLRVWGGGFYESDEFYDECDRLGLMVWQDFMFACAMYPEEDPFPTLIETEARHQITRLSSYPSVVLWCGGNECVWGYENWGWKERLKPGQSWGSRYYFELFPKLMQELNPTRPYWPNSPLSSALPLPEGGGRGEGSSLIPPNDPHHGDRHTWDAKLGGYCALSPRLISEIGHQSPSNTETLQRVLRPEELSVSPTGEPHPSLEHRQRGTGGTAKHIDESMRERLHAAPFPADFTEWHALAQQVQAEAMTIAIDWAIENRPRCMGILIWQLNDAWPGFSWSLIDSDGKPKPAYFAVQKAFTQLSP